MHEGGGGRSFAARFARGVGSYRSASGVPLHPRNTPEAWLYRVGSNVLGIFGFTFFHKISRSGFFIMVVEGRGKCSELSCRPGRADKREGEGPIFDFDFVLRAFCGGRN